MFPYSCDARLYYLPYATVGLILFNVLAFGGAVSGRIDPTAGWVLEYGSGLHPVQWLLSPFMHGSFEHLLGNMFFLWSFGLITEGKLGPWRFLAAYMGIAIGQSAIEQAILPLIVGDAGISFGASAAIYGLMAMACVWAPANELSIFMIFMLRPMTFEMAIGAFAALYVGLDVFYCFLFGAGAIGSVTHLMGGVMGFVLGTVLFKTGAVDCEDWDLFSVLSGTYGAEKQRKREAEELAPKRVAEHLDAKALEARRKFDAYLQINQPEQALAVKRSAQHMGRPLDLDRKDLLQLITALHKQQKWAESAPVMAELLEVFPVESQSVRLKLAQICLVELERPGRALDLIDGLDGAVLPPQQEGLRRKIVATAQRQVEDGELEVDDGGW